MSHRDNDEEDGSPTSYGFHMMRIRSRRDCRHRVFRGILICLGRGLSVLKHNRKNYDIAFVAAFVAGVQIPWNE